MNFIHVLLTQANCFSSGPPVEFIGPPEQVEVRVGEQARLHCEFRSSSAPVACCWIFNKDKVQLEPRWLLGLSLHALTLIFGASIKVLVCASSSGGGRWAEVVRQQ